MDDLKTDLRLAMRKLRRRLKHAMPDGGLRAAHVLGQSPILSVPAPGLFTLRRFATYRAQGSEMDASFVTDVLVHWGLTRTFPVAVAVDAPLVFRTWDESQPLVPDAAGILSPPDGNPEWAPDLLITPLLAFDRRGGRLGQGGGFYDRTLAQLRAVKPMFVLGLAYSAQELPEVPCEPHDQRLDAILTETSYIEVEKT